MDSNLTIKLIKLKLLLVQTMMMLFLPLCSYSNDKVRFDEIYSMDIPVVSIETDKREEPFCDYVSSPEGSMGRSVTNCLKLKCRVIITLKSDTLFDSGNYDEKLNGGGKININGNNSAYNSFKPYKIKLLRKADMLSRGDSIYNDKNWRLIPMLDLKTIVGLKVNEHLGMPWTPAYILCNVVFNGDYRGCYYLIESVKRNKKCRLNVDDTGFIVERDPYWWNENTSFSTSLYEGANSYRWTWKYPDEDEVTEVQQLYIQDYLNKIELSLKEGNYDDYIDVESFAAWLLAHDILGTWDSGGSNMFVMKYDDTSYSKLQMANMWDFDTIFEMPYGCFSRFHDSGTAYFSYMFNSNNKNFSIAYKNIWISNKYTISRDIISYVNHISDSLGADIQNSWILHSKRWDIKSTVLSEERNKLEDWFDNHLPLLDRLIEGITETTNIELRSENLVDQRIYDLKGHMININNNMHNKLFIYRKKKYLGIIYH